MFKIKNIVSSVLALCMFFSFCGAVEIKSELSLIEEKSNTLYRYELPDGNGFYCSMQNGEKDVMIAYFNFDTSVSYEITKDGQKIEYRNYSTLEENGDYKVFIKSYSSDKKDFYYADFNFSVYFDENAFADAIMGDSAGILKIDNIDLDALSTDEDLTGIDYDNYDINSLEDVDLNQYGINDDYINSVADGIKDEFLKSLNSEPLEVECDVAYNKETEMFTYTFPDNMSFECSIPNGTVTNDYVKIKFDDDKISAEGTVDDHGLTVKGENVFSSKGSYIITVYSSLGKTASKYKYSLCFDIINERSNLSVVNAPENYLITKVIFDGEENNIRNDTQSYVMNKDGSYEFTFSPKNAFLPVCQLAFERDTAAPFIVDSAEAFRKGYSNKLLKYSFSEELDYCMVFLNGERYSESAEDLKRNGDYVIIACDRAGNNQIYAITVKHSRLFQIFGSVILFLGLFFLYSVHKRKSNVRVL